MRISRKKLREAINKSIKSLMKEACEQDSDDAEDADEGVNRLKRAQERGHEDDIEEGVNRVKRALERGHDDSIEEAEEVPLRRHKQTKSK